MNNGFGLKDEQKESARKEIFENCPFRLDMPERYGIDGLTEGKSHYIEGLDQEKVEDFFYRMSNRWLGWVKETRITDNKSYLDGLAEVVSGVQERIENFSRERMPQLEAWIKEGKITPDSIDFEKGQNESKRMEVAFYIYGYGEAAREAGDMETYSRAMEIAGKLVPPEQYQDIVKRRLGPDGKFKITEEDLKHIRSTR